MQPGRGGEEEIAKRLRKLSCCLVGWWGGETSLMSDLKTIMRQAWSSWEVIGSLNVVEMGKGLWLFEFDNTKEAKRILKAGNRRIGVFSIFLKKMDVSQREIFRRWLGSD